MYSMGDQRNLGARKNPEQIINQWSNLNSSTWAELCHHLTWHININIRVAFMDYSLVSIIKPPKCWIFWSYDEAPRVWDHSRGHVWAVCKTAGEETAWSASYFHTFLKNMSVCCLRWDVWSTVTLIHILNADIFFIASPKIEMVLFGGRTQQTISLTVQFPVRASGEVSSKR